MLELLYVNRWRKLAVGSVRYGVMCTEEAWSSTTASPGGSAHSAT